MKKTRRILLSSGFGLLTLILAGCSTLPQSSIQRFAGRFSGSFEREGKIESLSGRYRYTVSDQNTILDLLTPLYGNFARIVIDASGASLQKGDEVIAKATSTQTLMQQFLGFSLPVEMLQSWLTGHPQQDAVFSPLDENTFEQAGCRITIKRRHTDGSAATLAIATLRSAFKRSRLTLTVDKE